MTSAFSCRAWRVLIERRDAKPTRVKQLASTQDLLLALGRFLIGLLIILAPAQMPGTAKAVTLTDTLPASYQTTPIAPGATCYVDAGVSISNIPPALTGGALLQTAQGDAANETLSVQFNISERAEVYVCIDPRFGAPSWLNTWVPTDMTLAINDPVLSSLRVYAHRFPAGVVTLGPNHAQAMYVVVVKSCAPQLPRKGWVLLSYDLNYLYQIISVAPEYDVNHLELSHDIVMYTHQITDESDRRENLNGLIDWAHAYGVPEVVLWTHEASKINAPSNVLASDGRLDGDNPAFWSWMNQRYVDVFSAAKGCPEADGLVLTFDELSLANEGVEVYNHSLFKHNCCSPTQSVAQVINTVQAVCAPRGKTLYARTWAGGNQATIRDAILQNGDPTVWLMNKNVGAPDPSLLDWQFMDTHHPMIGGLPDPYKEMIEFDIGGEYLGRGRYTFVTTSYLKNHWNYARAQNGADGAVARIDRENSLPYYGANRLSLYSLQQILANPAADPTAINLAWCQKQFPAEAAQDVAYSYDAPDSPWQGDTRYMTWSTFAPGLAPVTNAEAKSIAIAAIGRIDRHRAQLEAQSTLDTRGGTSDYMTLRNGLAIPLIDLGGTLPTASGFSNFRPSQTSQANPTCFIDIAIPAPGLNVSTITCDYSTEGGSIWHPTACVVTGTNGTTATQTITAAGVPFGQVSGANRLRFFARDMSNQLFQSDPLSIQPYDGPTWKGFRPVATRSLTPDCSIMVTAGQTPLDPATARFKYSTDAGIHWITPATQWTTRYECDQVPLSSGWTLAEGHTGYESVSGGVLRIHDTGTGNGDKVKYTRAWNANPAVGATVFARMRCAANGATFASNLGIADLQHMESLYLKANGLLVLQQSNLIAAFATSDWHTYRVTIYGQNINVYVDENPQALIRGRSALVFPSSQQWVMIGSGSSPDTQDIYYDYVYWTTAGAFAPEQGFAATFAGDSQNGAITAYVPFHQYSAGANRVRFSINDTNGREYESTECTVVISPSLPVGDFDLDGDVDQADFAHMQQCFSGESIEYAIGCEDADLDADGDVDTADFQRLSNCMAGPGAPAGC